MFVCAIVSFLCVCISPGTPIPTNLNYVADMMQKQRAAPIGEFEISHDSSTSTWRVVGAGLQRFIQMTNWRCKIVTVIWRSMFSHLVFFYIINSFLLKLLFLWNRYKDSDRRFQHVLEACGVNKSLMKLGVKEGDTVIVGGVRFFKAQLNSTPI